MFPLFLVNGISLAISTVLFRLNSSQKRVTEKNKTLETITKNKTTITIAHRLSTIINSDQIILFSKGKIIDVGTHKKLIKSSDYYKKLYNAGN